jgi:hypothetical protein
MIDYKKCIKQHSTERFIVYSVHIRIQLIWRYQRRTTIKLLLLVLVTLDTEQLRLSAVTERKSPWP